MNDSESMLNSLEMRLAHLETQVQSQADGLSDETVTFVPPAPKPIGSGSYAPKFSWRVWYRVSDSDKQYKVDDGGGDTAGSVVTPDGTVLNVDAVAWTTFTATVFLYLKVILTAAGAATITIETGTRPTPDTLAENPVLVFDLGTVLTGGTVYQYLMEDVSLQGLPIIGGNQYEVWQNKGTDGFGWDCVRAHA